MDWFQRHLNWTWVLTYLLLLVVSFVFGFAMAFSDPNVSEGVLNDLSRLIVGIPMLFVSFWVLKRKQRSLWWILLSGIGSPLWLDNKNTEVVDIQNGKLITRLRTKDD